MLCGQENGTTKSSLCLVATYRNRSRLDCRRYHPRRRVDRFLPPNFRVLATRTSTHISPDTRSRSEYGEPLAHSRTEPRKSHHRRHARKQQTRSGRQETAQSVERRLRFQEAGQNHPQYKTCSMCCGAGSSGNVVLREFTVPTARLLTSASTLPLPCQQAHPRSTAPVRSGAERHSRVLCVGALDRRIPG